MTDTNQVVDPIVDNSTPPATEIVEQPAPSEEDNAVREIEPKVEEVDPSKEERYKQQLQGSKEEALRWMTEAQKAKKEFEEYKLSLQKPTDDAPVSPEDLAAFNAIGKKLGFVTKQEIEQDTQIKTYKQMQDESLNNFLKEHPEYNKPGDADSDKRWTELQQELSYYNTAPADPKTWYNILNKAHRNLNTNPDLERVKGEALGMAKAKLAEQTRMGGGGSGEVSTPKRKQTPEQQEFASEIEEQLKKKPYYRSK